jgi:hypothetical protein
MDYISKDTVSSLELHCMIVEETKMRYDATGGAGILPTFLSAVTCENKPINHISSLNTA